MLVTNSTSINDGSRKAEANCLAGLVEPIPRFVKGQVSLERNDGTQAPAEDQHVALHHPGGDAPGTAREFDPRSKQEEAREAHQR